MQKYFKYKYKYFWEKVFKIQVAHRILFMYLKQYFKYLYFKYSPTVITVMRKKRRLLYKCDLSARLKAG